MTGTKLGPYEILEQLGAGGMGEVWLAQDTRLGRKVAVKVLPAQFASDPERLARFEQEARAAAALNHPHIAAVFDVGAEGTTHYMVQEYLQGESLRDLLDKGAPGLKPALALGIEIAEALRAAHRAGIVHRDLKPENVFVTEDGHAKVLDFGLAKLTEMTTGTLSSQSMSPTVLGTQAGAIMGTAGYMAPEQVQGEEVDARADVFAFGCLLWEMLTGQRAFAGKSVPHTLHMILDEPPTGHDAAAVQALPLRLRWLLERALAKSPDARAQSAADVLAELRRVGAEIDSGTAVSGAGSAADAPSQAAVSRGLQPAVVVALALLALTAGAATAWYLARAPTPPANGPVHFVIDLPEAARRFDNTNQQVLAISPDGQQLAFVAADQLWLRRLDDLEPVPLRGTADPRAPSFSPDSSHIAFWANDQIKRLAVDGGAPVVVGPSPGRAQGVTWESDGYIYVGSSAGDTIFRLPETGGQPETVVKAAVDAEATDAFVYGPRLLPGGEWLLFTLTDSRDWDSARIVAQSLATGERRVLQEGGHDARYSATGHLLYVTGGVLLAVRFDPDSLTVSGGSVPLFENLRTASGRSGAAYYAIATNGNLAYVAGDVSDGVALVWADRSGSNEAIPIAHDRFGPSLALSPLGDRLAVEVDDGGSAQVWVYDLGRASGQRITTAGDNGWPVWSPDGEWVYFTSERDSSAAAIWRRRADLSGPEEPILQVEGDQIPSSISSDGRWLYYTHMAKGSDPPDVYRLNLLEPGDPEPVVATPAAEFNGAVSPDGGLLAFASLETGSNELFVVEIDSGRRWRISNEGGGSPGWSRRTDELLYRNDAGYWSVAFDLDPDFDPAAPQLLREHAPEGLQTDMAMSPDAQRFITRASDGAQSDVDGERIEVVLNWFAELLARAPVGR